MRPGAVLWACALFLLFSAASGQLRATSYVKDTSNIQAKSLRNVCLVYYEVGLGVQAAGTVRPIPALLTSSLPLAAPDASRPLSTATLSSLRTSTMVGGASARSDRHGRQRAGIKSLGC